MDWTQHDLYATISGAHLAWWLVAYGAWRLLVRAGHDYQTGSSTDQGLAARTSRVAASVPSAHTAVLQVAARGRWERRTAILAKMNRSSVCRSGSRQRLRRVA